MKRDASLVIAGKGQLPTASDRVSDLLEAFLSRRSEATRKAYEGDLQDFAAFLYPAGGGSPAALWQLITAGPGGANNLVLKYKKSLVERGLSPRTINRRLAALRSAVRMARVVGLIPWDLEVEGEKAVAYRDTRGPGLEGVRLLLSGLGDRKKDVRDRAIIRLLYDRGLRRGEAARLDVEDVDLEGYTIAVMGKGRAEKEILTIPEETRDSLAAWIKLLGAASGPLFVNLDRGGRPGGRITGRGIYEVIRQLGARVGVKVRPHGLRHAAITEALNLLPGNTRAVQRFSRHSNLDTVMLYDDNREDLGGKVSRLVAKAAGGA